MQPRPEGVAPLATEMGAEGPTEQYLCRTTIQGVVLAGKANTTPRTKDPATGRAYFNSGCYVVSPAGVGADAPSFDVFVPVPGCGVAFRPQKSTDPFPPRVFAVGGPGGDVTYVCAATVPGPGLLSPLGGLFGSSVVGQGTHLGYVSEATGRVCRVQFYDTTLSHTEYQVLVET